MGISSHVINQVTYLLIFALHGILSQRYMSPTQVDYTALVRLFGQWMLIFFCVYILFMVIIRLSKYYRIKQCPNCSGELKRAQRTAGDRLTKTLSFGILPLKRYRCYTCYWEGPALDIGNQKKPDSNSEAK